VTPRGLGNDLVLLGDVVAHPVRQWRSWRDLVIGFLGEGGATVDSPPPVAGEPNEDRPIGARTVIQPDGDVVVAIDRSVLGDADLLRGHGQQVDEWYARSAATLRQAALAVRAVAVVLSGMVTLASAWTSGLRPPLYVAVPFLGVAWTGFGWLVAKALRPVLGTFLRVRIGRLLRRPGPTG